MSDVRAAWGRIVAHLRTEADWRAVRGVDQLSAYQYSEPLSAESPGGCFFKLEANLSHCITTLDENGIFSRCEFDDVLEYVDTMVRLGEQAVVQIEGQLRQRASGGYQGVNPIVLARATEGGNEISLQITDRVLPHEMRRFDDSDRKSLTLPEHSYRPSEEACFSALEQIMVGSDLRRRDTSEPGGTHDVDMSFSDSDAPPVRVEFTELTSEMGEEWSKRPRSGGPRAVKAAQGQLKYLWHASVNMTDTLFQPAWGSLVKDHKERKRRGQEIDSILLKYLLWAENQMGTLEGAVSLANQRIDPGLKPGGRLLVFPFFRAEKVPIGGHGGLTVSYDGYSVDYSTIGSSRAAEPINQTITCKAEKNQAGALPGEKWLVVYLDPVYAIAVALDIEALLKRPKSWLALASKIDRRHFEEVWLVWDKRLGQDDAPSSEHAINVVRFSARDSRYVICPSE